MRVLVADDHRLMVAGVRAALADAEDIEVVGEALYGAQVLPLTNRLRPDLVLLDLSMPLMDGLACLAQLRQRFPEIKVVILSAYRIPPLRKFRRPKNSTPLSVKYRSGKFVSPKSRPQKLPWSAM